jgi:uncharacterized protein YdiU (UPF0061 family)
MNSPEHPHHFLYALSALPVTNRFGSLPSAFHTRLSATPLPAPYLVCASEQAADLIGLDQAAFASAEFAEAFSGNAVLPGSEPLSAVYSGHQFGVWAGQLGDGRAILLGEAPAPGSPTGSMELQLKGAGKTPDYACAVRDWL